MNAEPMSETKVCDKTAMRDLAEGVLALLGDDCFLVLNERNNENSRLKMKQSIAHAMTKGNVCHDGMKGIFVPPHCDDAKECLFLRFVGEPYVIDIDSSRRAIVCKVRASGHTVETSKDNTQSFEARAKWCNEAIIQLATGGLLTVTTQSGSGTLAGNAHSDSFSRLCAASARSISAAINRQFLRPALQAAFPHSPMLVSFELAPEPVDDRLQLAQLLGAVNAAGFRPSAETVSELMNFEVQPIQQQPTGANTQPEPNFQIENRTSPVSAKLQRSGDGTIENPAEAGEAPLSADELAALRALGGEINPAQIAADAEYMTREMMAGLREPVTKEAISNSAEEHDCEAVKEPCPLQVSSLTGKETREKIKNLAPIEIGYSEEKRTGAQWAEEAKSYFLEHFSGRQMTIGKTDYMLHIPNSENKAKQATFGVNTQKRTEALKNLQGVIDNAVHLKSEDAKNKPAQSKKKQALLARTATFETFGYPATINGEKNLIWFNAITKKHGDRDVLFYEFGCTPIDKD